MLESLSHGWMYWIVIVASAFAVNHLPTRRDTINRGGCSPPEVLINGSVIPGNGGTDFASVQEVQFLGVIGPLEQKRICKIKCLNGVWVGPLCTIDEEGGRFQPMLKQCILKPSDPEVVISYQRKTLASNDRDIALPHGSTLELRCVEVGMYKFVGNSSITCRNGLWSAAMPHCVSTTIQRNFSIQAPPTIVYNVVSGDAGITESGVVVILPGSIVHFDCLFQRQYGNPEWTWTPTKRQYPCGWGINVEERSWKYRLSIYYAMEHDTGVYTCTTPRGLNNEVKIAVKSVQCPPFEMVDRNRVMSVEGNKMHSQAKFSCMEGYNLIGPDMITCTASGQWSADLPHCEVIQCPPIEPEDQHLKINSPNRTYGSKVYFSCPTGYRLLGSPSITCLKNQSWSDIYPDCEAIQCNPPLPPANGRVLDNGRYLTGDFIQYTCNAGYVIVGESISVCDDHGEWTQQSPICKPACEFPGEPANGHIVPTKFHYDIGEVIVVVCNAGLRLLGSQRLRCSPTGHWSSPLPHCRQYVTS
ncbi:locomotion-related protein Hikaru genki-like isoform X1 [Centruroides sculpturatus]|uniref:locomotion-related protein Hikaru genki-like isoform X1 n=1 Tax=Centruroides sculpturatus TaxID=218467 RepID=UPI000C6D162D|nr:locomotion-related protein Hikaru genki-like isoform X1 [Centruroides sculpturatus]